MDATVICISHAEGADGAAVGRAVASMLGYTFADDAIVSEAARSAGIFAESLSYAERKDAKRSIEVDFGRIEKTENLRELIKAACEVMTILPRSAAVPTASLISSRSFSVFSIRPKSTSIDRLASFRSA